MTFHSYTSHSLQFFLAASLPNAFLYVSISAFYFFVYLFLSPFFYLFLHHSPLPFLLSLSLSQVLFSHTLKIPLWAIHHCLILILLYHLPHNRASTLLTCKKWNPRIHQQRHPKDLAVEWSSRSRHLRTLGHHMPGILVEIIYNNETKKNWLQEKVSEDKGER